MHLAANSCAQRQRIACRTHHKTGLLDGLAHAFGSLRQRDEHRHGRRIAEVLLLRLIYDTHDAAQRRIAVFTTCAQLLAEWFDAGEITSRKRFVNYDDRLSAGCIALSACPAALNGHPCDAEIVGRDHAVLS